MTYKELKRRIKDEGLDDYAFIIFDKSYGPDFSVCVYKESDGTYSCIFNGERSTIDYEEHNKPEEETCEMIYKYAVQEKRVELAYQERVRQMHK